MPSASAKAMPRIMLVWMLPVASGVASDGAHSGGAQDADADAWANQPQADGDAGAQQLGGVGLNLGQRYHCQKDFHLPSLGMSVRV